MSTAPTTTAQVHASLRAAATFFTVVVLFHNLDHVRRGSDSVPTDVLTAGTLAIGLEVGLVLLIFMNHSVAPLAAAVTGLSLAAGYVVVHFTPSRGLLSDSFLSTDAAVVSIVAGGLEALSALVLGVAGLRIVQDKGLAAFATDQWTASRSVADALRHPVPLLMLVGNAVVLVLTFT